MATGVIMPRQGQSVESCIITNWNVNEGDFVKQGDVLFEYETDKSAFEEEAQVSGQILKIFFMEGDDVPCLDTVCVIGREGEDISEFEAKVKDEENEENEENEEEKEIATKEIFIGNNTIISESNDDFIQDKISPRARNLIKEKHLDISKVVATGPNGRVIERDVLTLAKKGYKINNDEEASIFIENDVNDLEYKKEYEDIPHSNVRKVIAKSMHLALNNMAQLTFNRSFDATNILNYRNTIKMSMDKMGLDNITINDIILYAVSRVILNHKSFNAHYDDEKLRVFNNVHLGMAVDTNRGLLVPTIFNTNNMSLNDISIKSKELANMATQGNISPDLLTGATFTVSNLGSMGIESFTPIVNPPQTGILGVCGIEDKVKVIDGNIAAYKSMNLSLTCDHRAVDGADAGRFLKDLCEALENFTALLAK